MKPKKITIQVPLTYWQCMVPKHRHKTEQLAAICIDRIPGTGKSGKDRTKWDDAACDRVIVLREAGKTFKEIGIECGVSAMQAKFGFDKGMRHRRYIERQK